MIYSIIIIICIIPVALYFYWHFFFFYRDPDRNIPGGKNIVSPADGTIVYIKKVEDGIVPISIKNKKLIKLEEIFKFKLNPPQPYYLVGVFMHPTDVHVNRAPISGKINRIIYTQSNNLPMTLMWWRTLLRIKPYELYSNHIIQNERNTILIQGEIPVLMVQIADIYVNKIECWIKEKQEIGKGERIGMIKMGSQVDLLFPMAPILNVEVKVGQKVKAGETIIASMK